VIKRFTIFSILFFVCLYSTVFGATPISIHNDWSLFKTKVNNIDFCYVASLPIQKEGTYKERGEPYATIMRKKGATVDEVSISSGFIYDPDKDIIISILKRKFPLFSNEEKAWTYDKNDDIEIVKQMKNGAKMYITGYSKSGAVANDTYSLSGFNDAYNKMIEICK